MSSGELCHPLPKPLGKQVGAQAHGKGQMGIPRECCCQSLHAAEVSLSCTTLRWVQELLTAWIWIKILQALAAKQAGAPHRAAPTLEDTLAFHVFLN